VPNCFFAVATVEIILERVEIALFATARASAAAASAAFSAASACRHVGLCQGRESWQPRSKGRGVVDEARVAAASAPPTPRAEAADAATEQDGGQHERQHSTGQWPHIRRKHRYTTKNQ